MPTPVPVILPVSGPLDSLNPVTDRAPGTLIVARDVAHRWWGPRRGLRIVTRPEWNSATSDTFRPGPSYAQYVFDGAGDYIQGFPSYAQLTLGVNWTLDIYGLVIDDLATPTISPVDIFEWRMSSTYTAILVQIKTDVAGASSGQMQVTVRPSSAPGTGGTAVTLTSTTKFNEGSNASDRHHIRVVREGATVSLYIDGVLEDSDSINATQGHVPYGSTTFGWFLCSPSASSGDRFAGRVHGIVLRDGAFTNPGLDAQCPMAPHAENVRFYIVGSSFFLDIMPDYSRFGAHGVSPGGAVFSDEAESTPPFNSPVQGVANYVDYASRKWQVVVTGGRVFARGPL